MDYFVVCLLGVIGGGICVFVALHTRWRKVAEQQHHQDAEAKRMQQTLREINIRQEKLHNESERLKTSQMEIDKRAVSYKELQDENTILKRDLRNIDVHARKLQLDHQQQEQIQEALDQRVNDLGSRYLGDHVKWVGEKLNPNNFGNSKKRLNRAIESVRGIGFDVPADKEAALHLDLKSEYELAVRAAFEREEQARIRAQIREEQVREREIERELQRLDREREAIKAALEKALAEAEDEHSEEVEQLRARLEEAERKAERTKSQAELTKSGHVYVISNIGSFGTGVFKIGMTRRLEPKDRVKELGDASVPFPFDVHMMISCDNAPALENALHRELHLQRLNKTNPRKEFFRVDIDRIGQIVTKNHAEVAYLADAEALEYYQSLEMSDEDEEFIERVYEKVETDSDAVVDET